MIRLHSISALTCIAAILPLSVLGGVWVHGGTCAHHHAVVFHSQEADVAGHTDRDGQTDLRDTAI